MIESLLNDLPRSDESRERVLEWLRRYEANGTESEKQISDASQDENTSVGNEVRDDEQHHHLTSIVKERLGSTALNGGPANSHNGLTASHGGPSELSRKGRQPPKAGQGGPNGSRKASTASQGGSNISKKRSSSSDNGEPSSKQNKTDLDEDTHGLTPFDPGDLVKSKDGTFKVPKSMQQYLNKHMKRCLSKEEREALFTEALGQTWILVSHLR